MNYLKGKIVAKGKTKVLYEVEGQNNLLIVESKNDITKNDDPSLTQIMDSKASYSNATTCAVFNLLKEAGIQVAFEKQVSETEFLAPKCMMIPLEVILRRYAPLKSSYLKRRPDLTKNSDEIPHRFHRLVFELDLKTTSGVIKGIHGLVRGQLPYDCLETEKKKPVDDPLIANPQDDIWDLVHPKIPSWDERSNLKSTIKKIDVLPISISVEMIEEMARKTFLVIEGAWAQLGLRLMDLKIEFGIDPNGKLLVSDVIDNDSWRLRTSDWQELSKQLFRDNAEMRDIADKYALVADLVKGFKIPNQVMVFWSGSKNDILPEVPNLTGVNVEKVVAYSGHKAPCTSISKLEDILASYPEGGVIIALIGMSNGLGPILAARTSLQVISVPLTVKEKPHDVWSSLEMPNKVPNATILAPENAVLAALNILAQKNPVAYMYRQYAIEELDK